ncbi:hypothetical protein ABW19_dt0203261 [Dactylella cylindrospora]|nr:hypothetical protein ABW19_dt0203261 [Dactylella cylindrospora]
MMAGINSIPLEVLFLITAYLTVDDLKSLKLTCADLNQKLYQAHLDELFGCRTYYATIQDLQKLLTFARHPSKAGLKLRHLRLNVSSPFVHIPSPLLISSLRDEDNSSNKSLFAKTCFADGCVNFEAVEEKEDQAVLTAALQSLPNLEIVEFIDHRGVPSLRSLHIHYPDLLTPALEQEFLEFYKEHPIRQRHSRLTDLFLYVMVAIEHSECRIREILVDYPEEHYMFVKQSWFAEHRRHSKGLAKPLSKLRILELNIAPPHPDFSEPDDDDFDDDFESRNSRLKCIPKFFSDVAPNVEILKLKWPGIADVWDTEAFVGEYSHYEPNLMLRDVSLYLPYLKRLDLRVIPFVERELRDTLLLPHKGTLKYLVLEDCALQSSPQNWSSIFEFIGDQLNLDSFFFDTESIDEVLGMVGEIPIRFRVLGNIKSGKCDCEVKLTRIEDITKTDFETGLKMIREFEDKAPSFEGFLGSGARSAIEELLRGPIGPGNERDSSSDDDDDSDDDGEQNDHEGGFETGDDWDEGGEEDEDTDDNFEDDFMGPPPQFPLLMPPPNFFDAPPSTEPFTSRPLVDTARTRLIPLHVDPLGRFVSMSEGFRLANTGGFTAGSVMVPAFFIPSDLLDTEALEGQERTVQNILANLRPNALEIGSPTNLVLSPPAVVPLIGEAGSSSTDRDTGESGSSNPTPQESEESPPSQQSLKPSPE